MPTYGSVDKFLKDNSGNICHISKTTTFNFIVQGVAMGFDFLSGFTGLSNSGVFGSIAQKAGRGDVSNNRRNDNP